MQRGSVGTSDSHSPQETLLGLTAAASSPLSELTADYFRLNHDTSLSANSSVAYARPCFYVRSLSTSGPSWQSTLGVWPAFTVSLCASVVADAGVAILFWAGPCFRQGVRWDAWVSHFFRLFSLGVGLLDMVLGVTCGAGFGAYRLRGGA